MSSGRRGGRRAGSGRAGPENDADVRRAPAPRREPRRTVFLALLLFLAVATLWPVLRNAFILYDDNVYVTANRHVLAGLSAAGVRWAFTTGYGANWHPLTWISHMTDASLFGLKPSGHHATSLLLHLASTMLLFLALRSLTGRSWPSAWVAGLFAVHPAHVESVAWISERKDVLSAAFWFAALGAYGEWVRKPNLPRYLLVLLLFAGGLMSKPMVVTLPFVLLLLDDWPLGRLSAGASIRVLARLCLEKLPLFAVAALASAVTFLVQRAGGAVGTLEKYPLGARIANALVAYVRYLKILVWPSRLAIFYPHPGSSLPKLEVVGAGLLLAAISAGAILMRRRAPYVFVGWFWFVGTLVPVIGLVQVGNQALADRYTYVPFVGLFLAVAWGVEALVAAWPRQRLALAACAGASLLAFAVVSAAQVRRWKDSETLFLHAIAVTPPNIVARNNLGNYYNETNRPAEALPHLYEALGINPRSWEAYNNLGHSLFELGRYEEAGAHFAEALRLHPGDAAALNNLARVRFVQGEIPLSARFYRAAVTAAPEAADVRLRYAVALLMENRIDAAVRQLEACAVLEPGNAQYRELLVGARALAEDPRGAAAEEMRRRLANDQREAAAALRARQRNEEAILRLRRALELDPSSIAARNDLGQLLTEQGRLEQASEEFRRILAIAPASADAHNNLGYTLALRGQKQAAIAEFQEALRLQPDLTAARNNLEQALREPGPGPGPASGPPGHRSPRPGDP
ncbi:MAG TPA: tetratricopeptide repeat protein [Thermoanaerobaculia bacterium]|nr:tetratricopeptide repeat protein [Thermoanaerobaculia bacterium]